MTGWNTLMSRLYILFPILILLGCSKEYSKSDFCHSKWESDEGTTIYFSCNDSCLVKNLKWNLIYDGLVDSIWKDNPPTFKGRWKIIGTSMGYQRIVIGINSSSFNLDIDNINKLSNAIGDPDEGNYYTFRRSEE